jgi:hypothetical protein
MALARLDQGAGLRTADDQSSAAGRASTPAASPSPARGGTPAPGSRYAPIYTVASDGVLHVLGPVAGTDVQRPVPFLPANARYSDLTGIDGMLYTSTSENCGGVANGIWAITLDESKTVSSWATRDGSPVGNLAFTSTGRIIAAIGAGTVRAGGFSNAVVVLDATTLQPIDWFANSRGWVYDDPDRVYAQWR